MKLYHFSDKYFDPDEFIPIGNFKKTIAQWRKIVTEFEDYLEQRRLIIDPTKISRLNCLFTFPQNVADGFKELEDEKEGKGLLMPLNKNNQQKHLPKSRGSVVKSSFLFLSKLLLS